MTLGQIARITPSAEPQFTRVTSNGTDAVLVNIRQSPDRRHGRHRARDHRAAQVGAALPPDIAVTPFYDQSELVIGAQNAVRDAILIGAVLAGLVLFVFLRSPRLMLITGLMLPAVLAAACLALYVFGLSFNMMTMGGLAAAVGLVVDDVVVMLEHIMRRMQEGARSRDDTARRPARRDGDAARRLDARATIVVFVPLAFIAGVTGGFFKALAVTMVAALATSLLYARFVIPLMAAGWLKPKDAEQAHKAEGFMRGLHRGYGRMVARHRARGRRSSSRWSALVLGVSGYIAYTRVPSGFMPKMDEGGFILDYKAKPGAAISDTDRILRQVEAIVRATPEVDSYSRRTGLQLGGGLTEADEGDFFIHLKGGIAAQHRGGDGGRAPARAGAGARYRDRDRAADGRPDRRSDERAAADRDQAFRDRPDAARRVSAQKVADAIGKVQGVVEVVNGLRVAGDAIVVHVDRAAAELARARSRCGRQAIRNRGRRHRRDQFPAGRAGDRGARARARRPAPRAPTNSPTCNCARPTATASTVRQIATVEVRPGQRQLTREDLAPFVAVTARLEGRDLGSAVAACKRGGRGRRPARQRCASNMAGSTRCRRRASAIWRASSSPRCCSPRCC